MRDWVRLNQNKLRKGDKIIMSDKIKDFVDKIQHEVEAFGCGALEFGRNMMCAFNEAVLSELEGGIYKLEGFNGDIMEVAKQELETLKEYVKKFEEAIDKADAKIESGGKEKDEEDGEEN